MCEGGASLDEESADMGGEHFTLKNGVVYPQYSIGCVFVCIYIVLRRILSIGGILLNTSLIHFNTNVFQRLRSPYPEVQF